MKKLFYSFFFLFLTGILTVVLRQPQHNLIAARQFLFILVWVSILLVISFFLSFLIKRLRGKIANIEKWSRRTLCVYIGIYGILLYLVSLSLRASPITDYGNVYEAASALSAGRTVENWFYFAMWTNNLGALSILTFCMKLGRWLGFSDPYYFVLGLNVSQTMAVMGSMYYLTGLVRKNDLASQWMAVVLFTMWTPVWGYTSAFYSDQLSFGGSVLGMALFYYGSGLQKKYRWIFILSAGILWGIGGYAKITAMIPLIAFIITILLDRKAYKHIREYLVFGLALALTAGSLTAVSRQYPSKQMEEPRRMPVEYWIAMGLLGTGTYGENEEFVNHCFVLNSVGERQEYCRSVILENWQNIFDTKRMTAKTAIIFGDGDIAPTSLIYPYRESFWWHWLFWEGDYYWKYACLSTSFFTAILFFIALGALAQGLRLKETPVVLQSYVAVFGLFVYLLLWETQNKQLYNHIPWMTLAAVYGLERIEEYVILIKGKILERRGSYAGTGTKSAK